MTHMLPLPDEFDAVPTRKANGNGNLRWLLAATFAVALMMSGWISTAMSTRVDTLEHTVAQRGERIATLENEAKNLKAQLDRIEQKLDQVLRDRR